MAHAVTSPPMLRIRRSAQSGQYAMTAAWQVVYTENCVMAYIFAGAEIDLSNLQAGDTLNIRVRKIVVQGGAWVVHQESTYTDVQPARHVTAHISSIPDVYGTEISMMQPGGVLRVCAVESYDAKRIGLP